MTTIHDVKKTEKDLGSSGTGVLEEMFPARNSGRFSLADYDPEKAMYMLVDGIVNGNSDSPNFSLDYDEAPTIETFVASPGSPGPGDDNPRSKPPKPEGFPGEPSGAGSTLSPSETTATTSQTDFANLVPGGNTDKVDFVSKVE